MFFHRFQQIVCRKEKQMREAIDEQSIYCGIFQRLAMAEAEEYDTGKGESRQYKHY